LTTLLIVRLGASGKAWGTGVTQSSSDIHRICIDPDFDTSRSPHRFVNLQGYDCALSLALKRRATCAFAKSFLNLINNFAAFIPVGQVRSCVSEMAGN
jgi:hypothetical protein